MGDTSLYARAGEAVISKKEIKQEGEHDEHQAYHPQRPSQPDGAAGVQPGGYSPLPSCPLRHKTSLQDYHLPSVTATVAGLSSGRTSENPTGEVRRIDLLSEKAMYACIPEIGLGFFGGVCAREDRPLTSRDHPHP